MPYYATFQCSCVTCLQWYKSLWSPTTVQYAAWRLTMQSHSDDCLERLVYVFCHITVLLHHRISSIQKIASLTMIRWAVTTRALVWSHFMTWMTWIYDCYVMFCYVTVLLDDMTTHIQSLCFSTIRHTAQCQTQALRVTHALNSIRSCFTVSQSNAQVNQLTEGFQYAPKHCKLLRSASSHCLE